MDIYKFVSEHEINKQPFEPGSLAELPVTLARPLLAVAVIVPHDPEPDELYKVQQLDPPKPKKEPKAEKQHDGGKKEAKKPKNGDGGGGESSGS